MGGMAAVIWLILAVVLFVIESATYQLVCIWFSFAALLSMIAALCGASYYVQLIVFLVASILFLFLGRSLFKEKLLNFKRSPTNIDSVVGQIGVVVQQIDNVGQTGRVTVRGMDWTARCAQSPLLVPEGSRVRVLRIDGVKLIVEPMDWIEVQTEKE